MVHKSVLLQEAVDALRLSEGSTVVDGTFGGGGHDLSIAKHIGVSGTIIAFDRDASVFATDVAREIAERCTFHPRVANFRDCARECTALGIARIDAALFDLGLSSDQLELSGRGFSFLRDEPLLMTFEKEPKSDAVTAQSIVNVWSESTIADILFGYGEERYSRRIARAIVEARKVKPIERTTELMAIIKEATPAVYHRGKTHFATRTFQALRMAVNDELGAITEGLSGAIDLLRSGGRCAVITFHSVEDRHVKQFFKGKADEGIIKLVVKKPVVPSPEEIKENPRSRSAKLRIVEKL